MVRTGAFQALNRGPIPRRVTKFVSLTFIAVSCNFELG